LPDVDRNKAERRAIDKSLAAKAEQEKLEAWRLKNLKDKA